MKEHESPYWMTVNHEGYGQRNKNRKEITNIAKKHGGTFGGADESEPERMSEANYSFNDKKSHAKATKEVRKAGHMVFGKDY